jgi:hypothetical protein
MKERGAGGIVLHRRRIYFQYGKYKSNDNCFFIHIFTLILVQKDYH